MDSFKIYDSRPGSFMSSSSLVRERDGEEKNEVKKSYLLNCLLDLVLVFINEFFGLKIKLKDCRIIDIA